MPREKVFIPFVGSTYFRDTDASAVYSRDQYFENVLLEQVQKTLWKPKSQLYDLLIPPEFIDVYIIFEKNEFDSEMTYTIMKKTIKELPVSLKSNQKKMIRSINLLKLILNY